MQKISPFFWFNDNAEEAVNFYTSLFKDSKIKTVSRYGEAGPGPAGSVMVMEFELFGQNYLALNGGPIYTFNEAVSLMIHCEDQAEVVNYWDKLADGGQPIACGWIKDKFGLCWQVVPNGLTELITDPDPEKSQRAMAAMMKMEKLDIDELRRAHAG